MQEQTLESLLRQYITNNQNQMFTSMPGRVIKVVDAGEQRVDVQPLVSRVKPDDSLLDHPVILSVPLVYPGSRSSQFSFPVEVGDTVLLVFSQRSIQRFKLGSETPHRPQSLSKYSRNDAIAIPGLFSFPSAVNNPDKRTLLHNTDDTVVAHNIGSGQEAEVRLKANGDIEVTSPGNVIVNCTNATINASSSTTIDSPETTVTGNMTVQGDASFTGSSVTHNGTNIGEDHTHSGVTSGSSNTGTPN